MGLFSKIFKGIQNLLGEVIGFLTGVDFDDFDDAAGVLVNKSSNIANIPVIYGTRKVGGTRVFLSTGGNDNEYLYIALVLCEGEVSSIGNVYINDVLSTDSKYSGLVNIVKYTGSDSQTYSTLLAGATDTWGANHRLRGVAYLAVRLKYDQDVFGSIPDIQAEVNGKKVYDPRSPSDPAAFSTNPALCLRDYLTNSRFGKGLSASQINDTSFSAAANVCDTLVTEYTGSSNNVKLLECNAVIDTKRKLFDNVKVLLQGMRGLMPFQDGQYSLLIDAAAPSGTPFRLDDSNITSDIKVTASGKNKKYNRVRAKFINPEANWQEDSVDWPPNPDTGDTTYTTFLAEDNGEELMREVRLSTITNYYSARDLARVICRASREHQLTVEVTATSEALEIAVGDVVELEHDSLGWTGAAIQDFRVLAMSLNDDGEVSLTLQEYSNVYTYEAGPEEDDSPESTLPDPFDVGAPSGLLLQQGVNVAEDGSAIPYLDIKFFTSRDAFVVDYIIYIEPTGLSLDPYEVRLSTAQMSSGELAGSSRVAYLVNPALVTTYYVSVRAVNDAGVRSSQIASSVAITGDTTAPSAVTLSTPVGGVKSIGLAWTNPNNDDFAWVRIQRRVSGIGSYVSIKDVFGQPNAAGAYVDGGLASATTYQYRAYAYDWSRNQSAVSNVVSAATDSAPLAISNLEPREVHGYVYYQTAQAGNPGQPSASDYDYGAAAGTNPFTGLTSGWGINAPTPSTNTANTGDPFWVSRFYITENTYNGTVTVEFSSAFQSTVFDGLVTFKNLNTELADSASSLVTTIDGGLIKTGVVDLANQHGMAVRQAKTSFSSTTAGFFLGNDSGTAKFNIGDSTNNLKWDGTDLTTTGLVVKDTAGEVLLDAGGAGIGQEGGNILRNGALRDASKTASIYLTNTANTQIIDGWETADSSNGGVNNNTSYWGTQGVFQLNDDHTIRTMKGVPVEFGETLYLAVNNFTPSGSDRAWSIQVQFLDSSNTFVSQEDIEYDSTLWGNAPQPGTRKVSQAVITVPNTSTIRTARLRLKGGTGTNTSDYVNIWNVYLGRSPSQITPQTVSTYIANASIDTAQIADLSVETLKIDDNAVTLADFTTTFPVGTGSSKTTAERETGLLPAGSAVIFLVNAIVNDGNSNPSTYDLYIEIYQRTSTGSYGLKAAPTIFLYSYGLDARMIKEQIPKVAEDANFANGGYLKCAVKLRVHNSTTLVNGGAIEIAYIGAKR